MSDQGQSRGIWLLVGAACFAGAAYMVLIWLGVFASPGKMHGPDWFWLVFAILLLALAASLWVRDFAGMDDSQSEVPENAPHWVKAVYSLSAVVIAAGLAAIGTWIAFGPGTRHFSISGFFNGPVGETFGRIMFGFGAVITWLIVAAFARAAARTIFGKK